MSVWLWTFVSHDYTHRREAQRVILCNCHERLFDQLSTIFCLYVHVFVCVVSSTVWQWRLAMMGYKAVCPQRGRGKGLKVERLVPWVTLSSTGLHEYVAMCFAGTVCCSWFASWSGDLREMKSKIAACCLHRVSHNSRAVYQCKFTWDREREMMSIHLKRWEKEEEDRKGWLLS